MTIFYYPFITLSDFQAHLQYEDNGCECHGDSCYCCVHADVKQINLNHTGRLLSYITYIHQVVKKSPFTYIIT